MHSIEWIAGDDIALVDIPHLEFATPKEYKHLKITINDRSIGF